MKRVLFSMVFIIVASAVASAQSFTYYFPQVAVGQGWRTTIFLSNVTASPATATLSFTADNGGPFFNNWLDENGNNVTSGAAMFSVTLNSGESRKFVSVDDHPLETGYATVTANASVVGNAMFSLLDAGGNIVAEAGVPMAIPLGIQAVFIDTTNGFRTGVAIANPNTGDLEVHFEVLSDTGQVLNSTIQTVPALTHISEFTDQLFPGQAPMVGRLQFWCMNPMVSVALRFSPTAQFTTMPPIAVSN
ncbi:MAG TPA: hypothetical protein VGK48_23380 [Terriglobia bacterium]|jgi:hypothetical protein